MPIAKLKKLLERKPRQVKLGKATRFVLTIGDEGAVLTHLVKGKVKKRLFTPEPKAQETRAFFETVLSDPGTPLMLLFDTIDQAYVQQTLPPVAALSVGKLIRRRLDREFTDDYVRNAILMGKETEGRRDWIFMMVGLQRTTLVRQWLDIVTEWPNRFLGIYMLPVETGQVMQLLAQKLSVEAEEQVAGAEEHPSWQFLVTYNKVSGLRQSVYQNGKLVLTRLGQPALDSNPEAVAGSIEQEILGTKEYLKRLSYQEKDGLHLVVIVAEEVKRYIDIGRLAVAQAHLLTPYQASLLLQLEESAQQGDRFADVLIATAAGNAARRLLKLTTSDITKITSFTLALYVQRAVACALALALCAYAGMQAYGAITASGESAKLEQQMVAKEVEMKALKERARRTPEDLDRLVSVVDLHEELEKQAYDPSLLLKRLAPLISQQVTVRSMSWQLREQAPKAPPRSRRSGKGKDTPPPPSGPSVQLDLALEFNAALARDRGRLQSVVTDTLNTLKAGLQGYQVEYTSIPSAISDTEQINFTLSDAERQKKAAEKIATAKISIIGPVVPPESEEPALAGQGGGDAVR